MAKRAIFNLILYVVIACLVCYYIWNKYVDIPKTSNKDCEFTRTYMVLKSYQNEKGKYVTVTDKEESDIKTFEIDDDITINFIDNYYYEFTFKRNGTSISDNITSIFENTNIVKVVRSTKSIDNQINESICM